MSTFTTEDRIAAQINISQYEDISQNFINVRKILKDLQSLTACPTHFDLKKLIEFRAELTNETFHISTFIDGMINKDRK